MSYDWLPIVDDTVCGCTLKQGTICVGLFVIVWVLALSTVFEQYPDRLRTETIQCVPLFMTMLTHIFRVLGIMCSLVMFLAAILLLLLGVIFHSYMATNAFVFISVCGFAFDLLVAICLSVGILFRLRACGFYGVLYVITRYLFAFLMFYPIVVVNSYAMKLEETSLY